ncbi:MAG TPA: hypothetical protein VKK79_18055 [Candidatus Lokiarchaeia archaeon]|nr:hypothetical protein [Candidatus Lokiarchaeia archaeon]
MNVERGSGDQDPLGGFPVVAYNCWQIQRALHRKMRWVPNVWREGPTLEMFYSRIEDHNCVGASTI